MFIIYLLKCTQRINEWMNEWVDGWIDDDDERIITEILLKLYAI